MTQNINYISNSRSIIYDLDVEKLQILKKSILDMLAEGNCLQLTDEYMDVIVKINKLMQLKQ